ncbi:MAG TPA: EI24 domain-containing protein, partial [Burkholderiales bacterium]
MSVARSLLYAAANVLHPRMLWLMLWPMLVAVAIWGSLALFLWGRLARRIALWLQQGLDYALAWAHLDLGAAALVAANVLLFLLFVPLVYLTALFILSLFGMQQMVNYVASRSYPSLERRRGGGIAGTGWNSLVAFVGLLLLGLLSVPFWLFPPLWPVIPLVILAWVNQRLLRYDALAEHADPQEMK